MPVEGVGLMAVAAKAELKRMALLCSSVTILIYISLNVLMCVED